MAEADPKIADARVSVAELRANLRRYLKKVEEGATFTIVSRGKSVARLGPEEKQVEQLGPRPLGLMKGEIWIADDFDDPMPQEWLDAYYKDGF